MCYNCRAAPTENEYELTLVIPAFLLVATFGVLCIPRTEPNRREFVARLDLWLVWESVLALGFLHSQIRLNRRLVLRAHRHSKAQNGQ